MSGSALDKVREETVALRQVCFFIANLEFATKCAYQNNDSCFVFDQHVGIFRHSLSCPTASREMAVQWKTSKWMFHR